MTETMALINIPQNGVMFFITKDHFANDNLNLLLKDYSITNENLFTSIQYQNIEELKILLISLHDNLSLVERKNLLCSFSFDNLIDILKNLVSLDYLYNYLINQDIIELISHGDLFSVIQPIYNIQTKTLFGYEFLLRGRIDNQIISPLKIYETANSLGLQHKLDLRARDISISKASKLENQNLKIFINFLPSAIEHPSFCLDNTFHTASILQVSLSNLVFEVVETENVKSLSDLHEIFLLYKKNGTRLAMDDVGAGYSSLNNLHRLSPDYVKIDRDLISLCDQNQEKRRIIESIVNLCRNLNILILAEGIEREEELIVCQEFGIHLGQGYLLGRPSEDEVINPYTFK